MTSPAQPGTDQRRVTLTLHLIRWLEHDGIDADATLHIPSQGTLRATSRRPD